VQKCYYEERGGRSGCAYANRCNFKSYHSEKQKAADKAAQSRAEAALAAGGPAPAGNSGGGRK
jgi:hypothetical protein